MDVDVDVCVCAEGGGLEKHGVGTYDMLMDLFNMIAIHMLSSACRAVTCCATLLAWHVPAEPAWIGPSALNVWHGSQRDRWE